MAATGVAKIGIVTVSDRASAGVYEDLSGKAIEATLKDYLVSEWRWFTGSSLTSNRKLN